MFLSVVDSYYSGKNGTAEAESGTAKNGTAEAECGTAENGTAELGCNDNKILKMRGIIKKIR